MAIASMNRFTLLTFHDRRDKLLKALQVFGDIHFRSMGQEELSELPFLRSGFSPEQLSAYETELEKVRYSIAKLAPHAAKAKMTARPRTMSYEEFDRYAESYDYGAVHGKIREQDELIQNLRSEIARRAAENDSLAPWMKLDVAPSELDALTEAGYLLGTVDKNAAEALREKLGKDFDNVYLELLGTAKDDAALLLLFPRALADEVMSAAREQGFTRASFQLRGMPSVVTSENDTGIASLKKKIEAAEAAIKALAPEHPKLQVALDYFVSVLEREKATQSFQASDSVLIIEGWVPAEDSVRLQTILRAVCGEDFYLEETPEEKDSADVPIKLKNNAFVSAFESITSMYAMPKYNEMDPTPVLAPFYWLFFGAMVGDLGYGLVILLGATLALKYLNLKEGMKSFIKFFQLLGISTSLMGCVYGGVFGVTLIKPVYNAATGVYKSILDSQADITTMLIISIVIGVIHIAVGLVSKMYMGFRDGDLGAALFDGLFWLVAVLSGIGWLAGFLLGLNALWPVCRIVFFASLVGLAATQGRSSPSIGGKIGNGLFGVYGITSYVGDIVSYTRIVALALSGSYIAYAFNLMMGLVVGDFTGPVVVSLIRLVFGIVIIVFGQTLNLGLSMLGGYVHSCRLQYVEFFGKFYEGGGVPFRPLKLRNEYIQINK